MGMTMIIGIGTEMAIFYVSEFEELPRTMPPRRPPREASRNRLRPITMTTLAAILTLLPLALAIGAGLGHPAAAGHRDHRRAAAAISACPACDAAAGAPHAGRLAGTKAGGSFKVTWVRLVGGLRSQNSACKPCSGGNRSGANVEQKNDP